MKEHHLSYQNMEIIKTENIKEEVTDSISTVKVYSSIEYKEQINSKYDIPVNNSSFGLLKYEKDVKEEEITTHDTGVMIKTEINDIKDETDVEHGLSYEQLKSIKTKDYKINCSNEYMAQTAAKCDVSLNKSDFEHAPYNDDIETSVKHNEKIFHCALCDFKTKYRHNFLQHHRLKHDGAAEIFHCELCDYETKHKNCLLYHHKSKHEDSAEIFHCAVCNFKTKFKRSLLEHHRVKHDDAAETFHCELCDFKTKSKKYLEEHHRLKHDDTADIFHCKHCNFQTKLKRTLLAHYRVKHDEAADIFHCKLCDFKTKHKRNVLRHHKSKHDDTAEIFYCKLCSYKTKIKYNLSAHQRLKHDKLEISHCVYSDSQRNINITKLIFHQLVQKVELF